MNLYLGAEGTSQSGKTLLSDMEREFKPKAQKLGKRRRLASGKLVGDVTAIKNSFEITYRVIKGSDLSTIRNMWVTGGVWELEVEQEDGSYEKYLVMFDDNFSSTYWKKKYYPYMGWLHKDVKILLEEV